MHVIALIRKYTIFYVSEIINEHLGLQLPVFCFYPIAAYSREKSASCVTLVAMVQEEMFAETLGDSDAGVDGTDFGPCRILSFKDDEYSRCTDDRLIQLIHLLDK
ncbi:MAG: hypothetical protein A3J97_14260 [Spirochaetes bacterium RIFOXYC1_FULL_54_7]|nr:MAG: hypothetical protein A3J97_14260 [Spirochaetes bacterium RIFOXYC1_FULL_54_7]